MSALDVFPASNLPEDAIPWGRAIESEARTQAYAIQSLSVASAGDNRASASSMGALGRQVNELYGRSSIYLEALDLSRTGVSGGAFVSSIRFIPIPAPEDGARAAFISLSSIADLGAGNSTYIEATIGGTQLYYGQVPNFTLGMSPPGNPSATFSSIVTIPGGGATMRLTLWVASLGTPSTSTLSDITVGIIYADRT